MNATALIVELVLAGILMLAALLLPAVGSDTLGAHIPKGLDGTAIVAVAIAAGFVLGVIVDRAADTLLDRWLGWSRLQFAYTKRIVRQRTALLKRARKKQTSTQTRLVADCFPEDWMRDVATQSTSESVVDNLGQLRIRIRVARNMAVLTPALTTSSVVAICLSADGGPTIEAWLVPLFHLGALLVLVMLSNAKGFTSPRTDHASFRSSEPKQYYVRWLWLSPATFWFFLQLVVTATVIRQALPAERPLIRVALAIGVVLTGLAIWAWWRMTRTYFATIWNYSRFNAPDGLLAALGGKVAAQERRQ